MHALSNVCFGNKHDKRTKWYNFICVQILNLIFWKIEVGVEFRIFFFFFAFSALWQNPGGKPGWNCMSSYPDLSSSWYKNRGHSQWCGCQLCKWLNQTTNGKPMCSPFIMFIAVTCSLCSIFFHVTVTGANLNYAVAKVMDVTFWHSVEHVLILFIKYHLLILEVLLLLV